MSVLGLYSPQSALNLPERGVRVSRLADLLRVLGVADYDVWRHPELVAASIALTHQVARVCLSRDPKQLAETDALVLVTTARPAEDCVAAPGADWNWRTHDKAPPTFVEVSPPLFAAHPVWRDLGIHLVSGRAEALIPQHPRRVPVSPATLAATLFLTDRPTLLPTLEYVPAPRPVGELADLADLADLGLCPLVLRGPSRRVGRGPGFPSRGSTIERALVGDLADTHPKDVLPPELYPLRASLAALCERSSHRLLPGDAGQHSLDREAKKVLQAEVAAGRIKGFALAITPEGDELQDLGMEVVVTLPRRVGQVILRLTPRQRSS